MVSNALGKALVALIVVAVIIVACYLWGPFFAFAGSIVIPAARGNSTTEEKEKE